MWSSRRIAATVGSQRLAHPTTAVAGTAFASWSDAVAALSTASDNVPAHCAALRSIREQPRDVATRVVQHCLTLQRYSDACASAAFPLLCDALAVLPEAGKPDDAANVIRLSMQRGAYVDSAGFGPLLRLYNQRLGVKAYPEVSRLWTWIQHTRAAHCSVARSAVVAATARDGQHGAAMRLEAALRVDGILLREEGLVPLLESLPIGEWQTAASLVRHWASEHKAASMHKVQKHGDMAPPSLATAMALVRVCAAAGKGSVARSALAHWLEDADLLMAMTPADFRDAFDAVLPACGPSSSATAKPGEAGHPAEGATSSTAAAATSSADLLRRLLLGSSVAVAAVEQPFSRLSDDKQALIAELLGYMAAAAALLRSRDDLLSVGDHIVRLGFGSSMFHVVTTALVKSLSPKAWREGKLAAVELSRKTKMEIPLSIQARLHVLHQSVAEDHEAVLDAALGR